MKAAALLLLFSAACGFAEYAGKYASFRVQENGGLAQVPAVMMPIP